jgi:hypothetical protein
MLIATRINTKKKQSLYDSYAASGYPRQGGQEAPKQATPQPLSAQTSGLASPAAQPQQQAPPSGYYSGVGMSGYYAPYNPYFQCKSNGKNSGKTHEDLIQLRNARTYRWTSPYSWVSVLLSHGSGWSGSIPAGSRCPVWTIDVADSHYQARPKRQRSGTLRRANFCLRRFFLPRSLRRQGWSTAAAIRIPVTVRFSELPRDADRPLLPSHRRYVQPTRTDCR